MKDGNKKLNKIVAITWLFITEKAKKEKKTHEETKLFVDYTYANFSILGDLYA